MENIKEALVSLAFIYGLVVGIAAFIGFFVVRNFLKKWVLVHPEEIEVPGVGKVTLYRMRKDATLFEAFFSLKNLSFEEDSFTRDEIILIRKYLAEFRKSIEFFSLIKNDSKVISNAVCDAVHCRSLSGSATIACYEIVPGGTVWSTLDYRRFIVRSKKITK